MWATAQNLMAIIGFFIAIFGFIQFLKFRKILDKDTLKMLSQAKSMWSQFMAGKRDYNNPTISETQIDARKVAAQNIRDHPIAGLVTKNMSDKQVFGFITDMDLWKGIGVSGKVALDFINGVKGFFNRDSKEKDEPAQKTKGKYVFQ